MVVLMNILKIKFDINSTIHLEEQVAPPYQHLLVTAERKFWRCVESGEPPTLFGVDPPRPRIEAVRIVDMSSSNAWAEFAGIFSRTQSAHLEHEQAKAELKSLVPDDAQQAIGHGLRAKRSKSGAISFDLLTEEDSHAAVQWIDCQLSGRPSQSSTRTGQSGEVASRDHPVGWVGWANLSLCALVGGARHRAQNPGTAWDRYRADNVRRPDRRNGQFNDHFSAFFWRVDFLRLAGLRHRRHHRPASHGCSTDLCPPLRPLHSCRDCRRRRSRCARPGDIDE